MKIGIWGDYDKGNFGDDLMAYMLVQFLKDKGHEIYLYNSSKALSRDCGVASISDVYDFVKSVDIVVYGGGGMLINNSLLRFLARKVAFKFELSYYHLSNALKKYNKQIIPISVGGSGSSHINNPYKKRILKKPLCLGGTVRLKTDLDLVDRNIFQYVPDIVMSSSYFFETKGAEKKDRLVLNLKIATGKPLLNAVLNSPLSEKFDIVTFGSHHPDFMHFGNYELSNAANHYQFDNFKDTISFLAESKGVVSSKLHIGVTALAMGTPFISHHGPDKAKEFLKTYDLGAFILNEPSPVIDRLSDIDNYPLQNISSIIPESYRHFNYLDSLLNAQ